MLPRLPLLLCCLLALPALAEEHFELSAQPSWVEPTPVDLQRPLRAEDAVSGLHLLLKEEQVRVTSETTDRFHRQVRRVESSRGVEEGSQLRVTFSPSHERLRLHGIWRTREGVRTQVLRAEDVKLLQQERALEEERIYSEERTALVFIEDVRVGDVLEEAYTLEGVPPLLRGHHTDVFFTAGLEPMGHFVHRLLVPESMSLRVLPMGTSLQPSVRYAGAEKEYRWEQRDVPAIPEVDGVPDDVPLWPRVQLTSFDTWAQVAAWALALYEGLEGSSELDARVEALRALPGEEERFLAAVRMVQDEVRYLGIEIGPGSYQPRAPGQVFARRFGDCKDKALLLATVLRALGMEAHVALVHSRLHGGVEAHLSSPLAFNHVIVKAQVAGRTEWVDATWTLQRGALGARSPLSYGKALVLASGTQGLEDIPHPPPVEPQEDVLYALTLQDLRTGKLIITTRYAREAADAARSRLASLSAEQLGSRRLDERRTLFSHLRQEAPPRVEDDERANVVKVEERYAVEEATSEAALILAMPRMHEQLLLPRRTERTLPLEVPHPVHLRERWEVHADGPLGVTPWERKAEGPASRMEMQLEPKPDGVVFQVEYRSLADRVAPGEVARHVKAVEQMRANSAVTLPAVYAVAMGGTEDGLPSRTVSLVISGVVLLGVGMMLTGGHQRVLRWLKALRKPKAEAPRELGPLVFGSVTQAEAHARGLRCTCGGPLLRAQTQGVRAETDGRVLTRFQLRCLSCNKPWVLSFELRPN